jgi:hypothetical protein
MKIENYKCDVCGATKGEANHWWVIAITQHEFYLYGWHKNTRPDFHVCGQACASKKLSEFMAGETK